MGAEEKKGQEKETVNESQQEKRPAVQEGESLGSVKTDVVTASPNETEAPGQESTGKTEAPQAETETNCQTEQKNTDKAEASQKSPQSKTQAEKDIQAEQEVTEPAKESEEKANGKDAKKQTEVSGEKQSESSEEKQENQETQEDSDGEEVDHPIRRKLLKIAGIFLGSLVILYLLVSLYFIWHFYPFTQINGQNCSLLSVKQIQKETQKNVDSYTLTLQESDGGSESISGDDIDLQYSPNDSLQKALQKQNPLLWVKCFWEQDIWEMDAGVIYDEEKLEQVIESLSCTNEEEWILSQNAMPVFDGTQFEIQEEVTGTQMDMEQFCTVVKTALNRILTQVDLVEENCYVLPTYLSSSKEVEAAKEEMNRHLEAYVEYNFSPYTEVVDATVIAGWLKVRQEDMSVEFDTAAITQYIAGLAEKYDTLGKTRTITTATGNQVQVEGGTYGWQLDQEAELESLLAILQANESVLAKEPAYTSTAVSHEGNDFGNTYCEVDLTTQHMWCVVDGQVVMESAVVTGLPTTERMTPQGVYSILYRATNYTLKGEIDPATGLREYETPVAYWMKFTNSGIGFHDATWQAAFGGSVYQTNGSHGCVNMPLSSAKELYPYTYEGMPVIVHY